MINFEKLKEDGYINIPNIYSNTEVKKMLDIISNSSSEQVFGEREYLIKRPSLVEAILSPNLTNKLSNFFTEPYFIIKSIYFDKPPTANWVVNWHQDLTINLDTKSNVEGFPNTRKLKERIVSRPSINMLENIVTARIHLDDCTKENGALRLIKGSHHKGVIDISTWLKEKEGTEVICEVPAGGILFMKPLVLHSSKRTENEKNRRVLHIEFCSMELEKGLHWKEKVEI